MLFATALLFLPAAPTGSSLAGNWTTPDHSIIKIYPCGSELCARILSIGPKDKPSVDANNPDASLRTRSLCGLTIAPGFHPQGASSADSGHIYDPESGKTYSAQMRADDGILKLRGYVGIAMFGRTETWRADPGAVQPCK